jgi:DNA-binding LacI/PurR family transcriptional regulator
MAREARRVPIYESIKGDIRRRIDSGEWLPGDRVPSEQELVKRLGVSRSQTRQALRDLEMEGYLERMPGKGSFVAPVHQRQQGGPSASPVLSVMLAVPELAHRGWSYHLRELERGFTDCIAENEFSLVHYYLAYKHDSEIEFLRNIHTFGVRGLAIWPQFRTIEERKMVSHLCNLGFPCVMFDTRFLDMDTDFAGTANRAAMDTLTTQFVVRGHTEIAYVSRDLTSSVMLDRFAGYRSALERAGVPILAEHVVDFSNRWSRNLSDMYLNSAMGSIEEFRREWARSMRADNDFLGSTVPATRLHAEGEESVQEAVERLLSLSPRPTVVLCSDNWTADVLIEHLRAQGVEIPGDLLMGTMDDVLGPEEGRTFTQYLAMSQNGYEVGRQAAQLLISRTENPGKPIEQRYVAARLLNLDAYFQNAQTAAKAGVKGGQG